MDWEYELLRNQWHHPETKTTIYDEDMPEELKP